MSLSRHAKRVLAKAQARRQSAKRARREKFQKRTIDLTQDFKKVVRKVMDSHTATLAKLAAVEAMEILVRNGEKANELHTASNKEVGTVAPESEGVTEPSVPDEPENGQGC